MQIVRHFELMSSGNQSVGNQACGPQPGRVCESSSTHTGRLAHGSFAPCFDRPFRLPFRRTVPANVILSALPDSVCRPKTASTPYSPSSRLHDYPSAMTRQLMGATLKQGRCCFCLRVSGHSGTPSSDNGNNVA